MPLKKIIFIVGPTAIGKTQVAFVLAQKVAGEIVSCDSMQIYKEITITSNKPSSQVLKKIPHHLIDIVSVEEEFDVAAYYRLAVRAVNAIHKKNKIPIVAGGSGMYMQVLLDGIFESGPKNLKLRQELEQKAVEKGNDYLYEELKMVDPQAAAKIHPHDTRRIIRALEVFLSDKKPISELQKEREGLWGKFDIAVFALNCPRENLYARINERVDKMFTKGLVKEVQRLSHLPLSQTARNLIGVKEVLGFLNAEYGLERAQYLMKLNTRHFAKRQLTWFRKDKRLKWIMLVKDDTPATVTNKILEEIKTFGNLHQRILSKRNLI